MSEQGKYHTFAVQECRSDAVAVDFGPDHGEWHPMVQKIRDRAIESCEKVSLINDRIFLFQTVGDHKTMLAKSLRTSLGEFGTVIVTSHLLPEAAVQSLIEAAEENMRFMEGFQRGLADIFRKFNEERERRRREAGEDF